MRYIDGLTVDSSSMCDWGTELSPSQDLLLDLTHPDTDSWLERLGATDTPDTIFALRDFMLQEALNVVKVA